MKWTSFKEIDRLFINAMHRWGITILRIAVGIVFLWFGALKVFGVSPVVDLVQSTYWFFPQADFLMILGIWEVLIGIGLLGGRLLRVALALMWLQMAGTLTAVLFDPSLFFTGGNLLLLTMAGEFVVKNLVLIAAGLVIAGHQVHPIISERGSND